MRHVRFFIALTILGLLGNEVGAQGKIAWSATFPDKGTVAKDIVVKGAVTLDAGWTVKKVPVEIWEAGGTVDGASLKFLANGQFDKDGGGNWAAGTVVAQNANTTYQIIVSAILVNGANTVVVRTAGQTVQSK